ncbi:ABC transporter ATP-binding protein [Tropicimonas sp. S265A]|uniref:ABC transporter ATP-binding protein n=1 Tax=Tropicimonas sp. S265A TaxID=3415134 RepID=UPI003C7A07F9
MALVLTGIHKSFPSSDGQVDVLRGIDLSVAPGESVALTGESGSGKSTLLHIAGGLEVADAGRVMLGNTDLMSQDDAGRAALRREKFGIVFQQFNLIPSLNVADNIAFQARLAGTHDAMHCKVLSDKLGLEGLDRRYPEQLSGGQQQRVAIGRALAGRPTVVLADEPTGNLDEETADTVLSLMQDLVAQTDAALLMVTHSARLAAKLDRRVHLSHGRIAA